MGVKFYNFFKIKVLELNLRYITVNVPWKPFDILISLKITSFIILMAIKFRNPKSDFLFPPCCRPLNYGFLNDFIMFPLLTHGSRMMFIFQKFLIKLLQKTRADFVIQ